MCARYGFEKPNDKRALDLMNHAAKAVVADISDITIAYGISDEYRYEKMRASVNCISLYEFQFCASQNMQHV